MDADVRTETGREDRPLTRADVERLLHEVGSPDKLDLSSRNLEGIDLTHFNLSGVTLTGANLSAAHLSRANLRGVRLSRAI